ncbi:MAG: TnpV protein [Eubacteriales bacterium]|nr:TnpV protein [Eubacteriales bacterium]
MKTLFEQMGGTYRTVGDYQIPNLTLPDKPEYNIGIWGQRRLDYLKKHKRILYTNLLTSGKLPEHLHEIDETAFERHELIVKQMMAAQGITEQLKADNMMKWVGMVNNIRNCADEIVRNELIFS